MVLCQCRCQNDNDRDARNGCDPGFLAEQRFQFLLFFAHGNCNDDCGDEQCADGDKIVNIVSNWGVIRRTVLNNVLL